MIRYLKFCIITDGQGEVVTFFTYYYHTQSWWDGWRGYALPRIVEHNGKGVWLVNDLLRYQKPIK
ncbi:hypothetical protein [Spirochaeta isovalerica]|uniref:Uncharacterized protein n=1 Tax=Spirochaeta isovalerica TaxID=150 RepID=A0A841RBW0_9SPIO|nr:hypothetical protein [Spirochaeta isovalerica]MBB6479892.1 hypothetical protein [Spirochaeta isovalerica]